MKSMGYMLMVLMACWSCEAYKILLISPLPTKSHYMLSIGLVKHLINAGHEITLVTAYPNEFHSPLLREIDLSETRPLIQDVLSISSFLDKDSLMNDVGFIMDIMYKFGTLTLQNPDMQKLLNDPKEKFDLIISEWMYNDVYAGLTAIYQCPLIWLSTIEPHWVILHLIDEFPNPTYTPDAMTYNFPPMSFVERIHELGVQLKGLSLKLLWKSSLERRQYEEIIVPIARKRGNPIPDFEKLRYNASLVFGNSHLSMGQALRLPQNYIPIGGYHIDKDVKPLPKDLQTLMDNAKNGVIYFSMGSSLNSKMMPDEMKTDLLKMFGSLKNTVLWKFEDDVPNRPSNVHIVKWAPQQSILAHPNCVLFITHGGLLSTTEAIHFAVPIIGIPAFGDQFNNVKRAVKKGFAKAVRLSLDMAGDLGKAIDEVINDSRYAAKVKELSFVYHHRPTSPGTEIVHWVEHVVLTKGAIHLRSPALLVSWYQKIYLDLACLVLVVFMILFTIIRRLFRKLGSEKQNAKYKTQ